MFLSSVHFVKRKRSKKQEFSVIKRKCTFFGLKMFFNIFLSNLQDYKDNLWLNTSKFIINLTKKSNLWFCRNLTNLQTKEKYPVWHLPGKTHCWEVGWFTGFIWLFECQFPSWTEISRLLINLWFRSLIDDQPVYRNN